MSVRSAAYATGMHNSAIVIAGNRCIQNVSRTETRVSRLRDSPEDRYLCDTLTVAEQSITAEIGQRKKLFHREEETLLNTLKT